MPFRDAYKKVGLDIEQDAYHPEKAVNHTHEGSIGNLNNDKIQAMMMAAIVQFQFEKTGTAYQRLLG